MAIAVDDVADKVLAALKGAITGQVGTAESELETAAQDLAQALATIERDRLADELSDQQARDLIDAAASSAMADLEGVVAQGEADLKTVVVSGLKTLADVALTAAGLGWAAPIIQAAAAAL